MTSLLVVVAGTALALWSVLSFALIGRGIPAPFDPPRRLVARGPCRHVRNPMYLGAGMAVAGAAWHLESLALLIYAGLLMLVAHLFVVRYEEPVLRRRFGADYEAYCGTVRRWTPGRGGGAAGGAGKNERWWMPGDREAG